MPHRLQPPLSSSLQDPGRHISEWALQMPVGDAHVMLFGCTEDVACENLVHSSKKAQEMGNSLFVCQLCPDCQIPVCHDCWTKLYKYHDGGTIPTSLSNDNFTGYVARFLVENQVTWLECAASSVCWSTMLVYYLEDPFGHLMNDTMGDPKGRTRVRGNLFSFNMPWEDIERSCNAALKAATVHAKEDLQHLQDTLGLPHSEETLALLVNVHICGGTKDLALHLKGLTLRVSVV